MRPVLVIAIGLLAALGSVAVDRPNRYRTFESIDELLGTGDAASLQHAAVLATEFEQAFGDGCLRRRVATFRDWTAEQRRRWDAGKADKEDAKQVFAAGRLDEADAAFTRLADLFQELGDAKERTSALASLGTVAAVGGQSQLALERLELAQAEAHRACDRDMIGVIALTRAYALDDLGRTDEALAALEESLGIAREAGDVELELRAQLNLGATYERVGRLDEARIATRRAADLSATSGDTEGAANAWFNLGILDRKAGDFEAQRVDWSHALELTEQAGLHVFSGEIQLALARLARLGGKWDEDRQLLDRARTLLSGVSDGQIRAHLELSEAQHRIARSRFAEALPFLAKAEQQLAGLDARSLSISTSEARAIAHYYLGDYAAAETALRRGVAEAKASEQPLAEANCRSNLGLLLFHAGRTAEGLVEIELAAETHRAHGSTRWNQDLDLIGFLRFVSGDLVGARTALEASLEGSREAHDPTDEFEALADLARVELAEGGARRANGLARLAEARAIAVRIDDTMGILTVSLMDAGAAIDSGNADSARVALAQATAATTRMDAVEFEWKLRLLRGRLNEFEGSRDAAIADYRDAIAAVERRREKMPRSAGRAAVLEDRFEPYRRLARLLRAMSLVEDSWEVARAGKARTFVEGLLPPTFDLMRDEALRSMLDDAGAALPNAAKWAVDAALEVQTIPGSRLQELLRAGERLLDMYIDQDQLHIYLVDRERIAVRSLPLSAGMLDLVSTARWPGRPGEADRAVTLAWRNAVLELGRQWIAPLADDLRGAQRLLIVPNGRLHELPFAALDFEGKPLIAQFEIAMLPAAETLVSRLRDARGRGLVALGDPPLEPRLPGAAREAREIARRVAGGAAWVGAAATEERFRRTALTADRIHLAAHGNVDRLEPARSHIVLASGAGEDGRLQADEVAAMHLDASLVVLSGCKTAVEGAIARANGPADERIGLPRAFLTAGAGSVIAGMWEMDDEAARRMMSLIYDELEQQDASGAVSTLQRRIVDGKADDPAAGILRHPFYWAGLVAYGAGLRESKRLPKR